jgi:hypothetical protein
MAELFCLSWKWEDILPRPEWVGDFQATLNSTMRDDQAEHEKLFPCQTFPFQTTRRL